MSSAFEVAVSNQQAALYLPPRQSDDVIRDKLERITRALADPEIEPAAYARLSLEADRLRQLLPVSKSGTGGES